MAWVVRSIRREAASPSFAYLARVRADRAAIAFWRCSSGLVAVAAASRTLATPWKASRAGANVQISAPLRVVGSVLPPGPSFVRLRLRRRLESVMVALAMRWLASVLRSLRFPLLRSSLCLVAAAALPACGHPATEVECQTIVERIVLLELQAQKVTDPGEISKRRSESLGLAGDGNKSEVLQGCVGRHITDSALACVRRAESAQEITDRCLR